MDSVPDDSKTSFGLWTTRHGQCSITGDRV